MLQPAAVGAATIVWRSWSQRAPSLMGAATGHGRSCNQLRLATFFFQWQSCNRQTGSYNHGLKMPEQVCGDVTTTTKICWIRLRVCYKHGLKMMEQVCKDAMNHGRILLELAARKLQPWPEDARTGMRGCYDQIRILLEPATGERMMSGGGGLAAARADDRSWAFYGTDWEQACLRKVILLHVTASTLT